MKEQRTRVVLDLIVAQGWVKLRSAKGSHELWGTPDGKIKVAIPSGHRMVSAGVIRQLKKKGIRIPDGWN